MATSTSSGPRLFTISLAVLLPALAGGCGLLLGLDEFHETSASGSGGAAGTSTGNEGGGSSMTVTTGGGAGGGTTTPTVPALRTPMNDSYVGSTLVAGTRRPKFTWEPSSVVGGEAIEYELEYGQDPVLSNATSVMVDVAEHRPATDLPVSLIAPVGRRYYWRVRACAAAVCSAFS